MSLGLLKVIPSQIYHIFLHSLYSLEYTLSTAKLELNSTFFDNFNEILSILAIVQVSQISLFYG